MKNKNTTEALIKALNFNNLSDEKPTEGWITALELAQASNRSLSHTSKKIRQGILSGSIETKIFRVTRSGAIRCVPYYKVKGKRS